MGQGESHTFFGCFEEVFPSWPFLQVSALSQALCGGKAGRMYRQCLGLVTFGKRCGVPPRAR